MCGIAGVLSFDNEPFEATPEYITEMHDCVAHRGPDGDGSWISEDSQVGLGHRRLAIVDLTSEADQPMSNEDNTVQLLFNGEIYNHAETRAKLEATGNHEWQTDHSDTEVIVHAYEEWGIDCIERFRGMFAFALWDADARDLWLVRDRIGVKPLYYSSHDGRVVFGSEIKSILQDPDQQRAVDEEAFYHYLSFLTTPAPETLFDGIKKLPGGTKMRISADGEVERERYWDVWDQVDPQTDASPEEVSDRVLSELRKSVEYRKESDVPIGVFLSGGVDSSTNAALFSKGEDDPVQTFSIGYDDEYGSYENELHFAREMAEKIDADYHERVLDIDDLMNFLPEMIRLQDEPIADPVCVPVYYVSKLARDNDVIVCQVGEGADELFCGYQSWQTDLRLAHLNDLPVPKSLKRLGLKGLELLGREETLEYEKLRRAVNDERVFWSGAQGFTEPQKERVLSDRLTEKFEGRTSFEALEPIEERFEENAWEQSHLNWMTYVDLNMRLPELLLMRVDKMSMGVSLECRVPFLDQQFVEYAMSIPTAMKTQGSDTKTVLKRAVRGLVPDRIIDREKQGFGVPVHEWLFEELGDTASEELVEFCDKTDFLDKEETLKLVEERKSVQSWYLLNFALWYDEFIDVEE